MADMLLFAPFFDQRLPQPQRRFRLYNNTLDEFRSDKELKSRFRFNRETIEFLVDLIGEDLTRATSRNHALSSTVQVLVALRFFASGNFLEVIGDTFGLPKSTVSRCITEVAKALVRRKAEFIVWPDEMRQTQIREAFFAKKRFPGVIGCIDCTHVKIIAPTKHENDFVNRKGFHSLNVQAVCDDKGLFTNVVAKWPGNAHDSFVFKDSALYDVLEKDHKSIEDGFLIGDSGYGCRPFIIPPYPHPSTQHKEDFNEALGKTRVKIEQTFGVLKRRFHLLHGEVRMDPSKVSLLIGACTILHNIAVIKNDIYQPNADPMELDDPDVTPYEGPEDGLQIRDYICENYF